MGESEVAAAPASLPPINNTSPLLAQHPLQTFQEPDISDSGMSAAAGCGFDIGDLQSALLRSRQQAGGSGGLRRAVSAPHSMDSLGWDPASLPTTSPRGMRAGGAGNSGYLQPSGGPMRRVASSLGMRRSSSFFWTPAAHHDFERAVALISSRGAEISADSILAEMSATHAQELKLSDVDKHLRKKMLVHRRVLQQLSTTDAGGPGFSNAPRFAAGNATAMAAGGGAGGPSPHSLRPPPGGRAPGGPSDKSFDELLGASPVCLRPAESSRPAMAAVAEEPAPSPLPFASGAAPAPGSFAAALSATAPPPAGPPNVVAAAAAAQALTESLSHQLQAQHLQHMQITAAREAMVAGESS